jgi:uncharacterized protein
MAGSKLGSNNFNLNKDGFDFADAYQVFELLMAVGIDNCRKYGEDRWIDT